MIYSCHVFFSHYFMSEIQRQFICFQTNRKHHSFETLQSFQKAIWITSVYFDIQCSDIFTAVFFSSKDWNTNLWTNIWIMNKIRLYDWIINHSNVIYEDDSTRCVNCRKLKLPSFIVVNYSQSLCWNMTWSYWHKSIAYSHIQRWETCDHNK